MSSGSGGKSPSSQPGRSAAETPGGLVARGLEQTSDSMMGANDTAVAVATDRATPSSDSGETPRAGTAQFGGTTAEIIGVTLSDRYLVTRKVGQGGMGAVYEATHTLIGKRVAVKVLLDKYAQREVIVARLKQEAQLASSIGNEHIIDITDFGTTADGRTFVVMEFLEGESLAECLAREPQLPEQRILRIAQQTTNALSAAHDKGIVHRDIKPENVFLLRRKETDFVKVVDFGISKSMRVTDDEEQVRLTQTGMVLGTPLYMSPEQARGDDELDHRVDVYALGVIMYEASTGRVPYVGNNYLSVISQVLNEEPTGPRELRPDLSEEFEAIVLKAMAKDRVDRYGSAVEMHADISALIEDPTHSTERAKISGPRRRSPAPKSSLKVAVWIGAIALTVLALVVTVSFLMRSPATPATPVAMVSPDAAMPVVVSDASVVAADAVVETVKLIDVTIDTQPTGARIVCDGLESGPAPQTISVVDANNRVECWATLENYDAYEFKFNPAQFKGKAQSYLLKLERPKKGAVPKRVPPTVESGGGSGSAKGPENRTGGELGGFQNPNEPR